MQNVPMIQNCISKYVGDQKYSMNTPINSDSLKSILPEGSIGQVMKSKIEDQMKPFQIK